MTRNRYEQKKNEISRPPFSLGGQVVSEWNNPKINFKVSFFDSEKKVTNLKS